MCAVEHECSGSGFLAPALQADKLIDLTVNRSQWKDCSSDYDTPIFN